MIDTVEIEKRAAEGIRTTDKCPTPAGGHVIAILPRGEAIRNFVYSGALDQVAKAVPVSVLSVLPSLSVLGMLSSRYGTVLELESKQELWPIRMQQELLDMAHGRWLWSEAAKERWRLRDLEAAASGTLLKRRLKKLACYPFANARGLAFLSWLECASSHLLHPEESSVALFKKLKPSLVFNGSHVHSAIALPAVKAAKRLGISTAAFIFSWDNLTSQGRIMPSYDYYFVWNEAIREELLRVYPSVVREQVIVTGTPQFDFHFRSEFHWTRDEFCRSVGADPRRPIVLYTTGMPNHMPGEEVIVERIGDILAGLNGPSSPQLLVRVYPKDRTGRFENLRSRRRDILFQNVRWEPNWLTPEMDDSYVLTNTLRHAALGINIASTVSLELCMFDKPVINVGYNPPGVDIQPVDYGRYYEFDHYRPVVASGAIEVAKCEDELRQKIEIALAEPDLLRKQRTGLMRGMFGSMLDGESGHRVANQLIRLARRHDHR